MHSKSAGFSAIILIVVVLLVGLLAMVGFKVITDYRQQNSQGPNFLTNLASSSKCSTHPQFAYPPIKLTDLGFILPMGRMSDSHVTPVDHQYWAPKSLKFVSDNTLLPAIYDVYSPADGTITQLENHTQVYTEGSAPKINDWRLVINHSCGVSSIYIHIDKLAPEIQSQIGKQENSQKGTTNFQANIPVKAGQVIGKQAEHEFDFSMYDENVTLPGILNPDQYKNEPWKIHTVDPFDYFADSISKELLTKVVRQASPRGGKIDYDIPGRLVGNWFKDGYDPMNMNGRFWDGQLTIAYNSYDSSQIFISIGNFNGKSAQFAVLGNSPDPKDVGIGQTVTYQVVNFSYIDDKDQSWNENRYTPEAKLIPETKSQGSITFNLKDKDTLEVIINSKSQLYKR